MAVHSTDHIYRLAGGTLLHRGIEGLDKPAPCVGPAGDMDDAFLLSDGVVSGVSVGL